MEKTGPLLYLVQVSGGQMWKRPIDQLRQMADSPQKEKPTEETHSDKETMIQFPPNQTANDAEPVNDEPVNDEPTPTGTDSTPTTHRYPRRVHVPPDRLTYNYGTAQLKLDTRF